MTPTPSPLFSSLSFRWATPHSLLNNASYESKAKQNKEISFTLSVSQQLKALIIPMTGLWSVGSVCIAGRRECWHYLLKINLAIAYNINWVYHQESAVLSLMCAVKKKKNLWLAYGDIMKKVYVNFVCDNPSPREIGKYLSTEEWIWILSVIVI